MIYPFSLKAVSITVGVVLILTHLVALIHRGSVLAVLKKFPRSRVMGIALTTGAAAWSFWLLATMDLGEFTDYRAKILIVIPIAWAAAVFYVEEFLAVRATGMLLLLVAEPLLEAAFLQPEWWRLLLAGLAYFWIVSGLFLIGMPYLLRNWITKMEKSPTGWRLATFAGIAYGVLLIAVTTIPLGRV